MTKVRDFLGPYRLTRLIRMGSSCQVWEAIEANTNQRFALKVLREDFRNSKEEVGFLKNEFEIASTLTHPCIIKIHDLVLDKNLPPFLVLELFSELNIKQAMRRGPESIAYMLNRIIEQSIEGLYYMHSQGWVHCDIKPDNFLVSRDGDVKLIDFTISQKIKTGFAKWFSSKPKNISGTRSYMSPEQIRGQALDPRSDIYSFGCVLYELVTGKPPFTGSSPSELLNKHLSAPIPSPLVLNDNVTSEYAAVIRATMAKKPEDRPASMWELLKTLRATKVFKKPPRIPEINVFDDIPTAGRVHNQEQVSQMAARPDDHGTSPPSGAKPS
ncbi:MAG: serine/threonine protein kinase [Pirellulaceae bacterium]|nr:serine/threonine protein kinase [Pirellulaceae bacterium]